MSKLPKISGKDCVKALVKKKDFYFRRQTGSHIILRKDDPFTQLVIPNHKQLDRGTLRAIIRQSGLSVEKFIKLL
ncbi:MAG: type II toxin-antitoxin system HicA family toxin [Spirochaetes bacterium]|nr:type II toxin-antitoxin system HicA family toxin [Spirochaetota bacterium]